MPIVIRSMTRARLRESIANRARLAMMILAVSHFVERINKHTTLPRVLDSFQIKTILNCLQTG
jgi:hypothetical protein